MDWRSKYLDKLNGNIDKKTYMYYRIKSIGANSSFISIEYEIKYFVII